MFLQRRLADVYKAREPALTLLSHALEVNGKPAFIVHERFIPLFMCLYPIAHLSPQLQVVVVSSVELIGKGTKEAVAVPQG